MKTAVRNLTSDLRATIRWNCPRSLSNASVYGDAMLKAEDCHFRADDLLQDRKYTDAQIRSGFNFRIGHIYNRKHVHRYSGLPGVPLCPLCGNPDSGTHIMLACKCEEMHKLYVERHNKAVRIIANAALKGQYASSYHTVDGGLISRLELTAAQHVANRTPVFLTNTRGAVERRPDILQAIGIAWEEASRYRVRRVPVAPPNGPDAARTINIGEVGYGVDTRLQDKAAEKRQQHAALEEDLTNRGWTAQVYPSALGVSGAMQPSLPETLWKLGIRGKAMNRVASQLQRNAVQYCHALHVKRRCLERERGIDLFSGGAYTGHGPPGV